MLPNPAQLPLRPVRSFPAAAVPMTVGPAVGMGPPAAVAPAGALDPSSAASATPAAAVLARSATPEGYGVDLASLVVLELDRDGGGKAALTARVGTPAREPLACGRRL